MLSEQLKIIRKSNGFTQAELSQAVGIERSTYASYETGRNRPDVGVLGKIAEVFGVTVDYIINIDPGRGIVLTDKAGNYNGEPDLLSELSPQEKMIIAKLRLDEKKREKVVNLVLGGDKENK